MRWRILFAIIDLLGSAAFTTARAACALWRFPYPGKIRPPNQPPADPRRILLIQLDHLGDAIISTVMLGPLRRRYPRASIEILAAPRNRELFETLPEVNRVRVSQWNRFGRGRRLGWIPATIWWGLRLRRRKYDLAIDVRGEFPHALLMWLSGAPRRLGWDSGGGGFLLTDRPRFVPGRAEVQSRMALLGELGIEPALGQEVWRPAFPVDPQTSRRMEALWETSSTGASLGPRIVLHVGAGTRAKAWPPRHWRELIGRLVLQFDARLALIGDLDDCSVAHQILGPKPPAGVIDCTGKLDIDRLAGLLLRADLFVGADSGPAHLAAAVGTPVVVLFSGTNLARQWQPWGRHVGVVSRPVPCSPCHRQCCRWPDHPCMNGLSPDRVAGEVERTMAELIRPRGSRPTDRTAARITTVPHARKNCSKKTL
jgi:heptosyltransferase-2